MKDSDLFAALKGMMEACRGQIRVKLVHDGEPTKWNSWLISPETGYFEVGSYGPFLVREAEWFEIQAPRTNDLSVYSANFSRCEVSPAGDVIRVYR
jgi:hypothetical protein